MLIFPELEIGFLVKKRVDTIGKSRVYFQQMQRKLLGTHMQTINPDTDPAHFPGITQSQTQN